MNYENNDTPEVNTYHYKPYGTERIPGVNGYGGDLDIVNRRFGEPVTWNDSYMKKILELDILDRK